MYYFNDFFSMRTNIYSEGKSTSNTSSSNNFPMRYFTMPLLMRLSTGGNTKFYINAGPFIGILQNYSVGNIYLQEPISLKRMDSGWTGGFGIVSYLSNRLALSVDLRNNRGLLNIMKNQNYLEKTYSFSILSGIEYFFGGKQLLGKK